MRDWPEMIDGTIEGLADTLRAVRRHLHAHPEPSREEFETTRHLARILEEAGIPFGVVPSGRGIIAGPEPDGSGPIVAMRADIDALRIHDAKDVPYRSTRDGVMHACGHDAHATMVLGAALALHRGRDALPGAVRWRAIFQPAEEIAEGAAQMVAAGAMEGVGAIVALHVDPERPAGRVGVRHGVLTAACQDLHATIHGRGGHAARPHHTIDPIAVAAQFVTAAYALVPRSVDAREAVVVSFGAIAGGISPNVIPEHVVLQGTIRTLGRATAQQVEARLQAIARGLSEASGATIEVAFRYGTDAVVNDPRVTDTCARAAGAVVGPEHVEPIALPSMGAEDFAAYLEHAPGCLMRLGVARPGTTAPFLHSPLFDIDERALAVGAKVLAHSVVRLAVAEGR